MMLVLLAIPVGVLAQAKDVTVSYLRAAGSSLADRDTVSFDAIFVSSQGMAEPTTWNMRGRKLSRFSVRDPQSGVVFPNMYCSQDSKAFKELIKLDGDKAIHITGYKAEGELHEVSIYVNSVEVIPTPTATIPVAQTETGKTFRVILKDTASGTKTILANVVPGKTYTVESLTLTLEAETESTSTTEKTGASNP